MSTLIPLLLYLLLCALGYAWWATASYMRTLDRLNEAKVMLEKTRDRLIIHPDKRLKDKEIDTWLKG
jgi:hypothetical protein